METSDTHTVLRATSLAPVFRFKYHLIADGLRNIHNFYEQRTSATQLEPSIKAARPPQCSSFGAAPGAGAVQCDGPPQDAPLRASTSEPGICG
jgi:hypothetical protein